jgi:hypothetical protein
MSRLTIDITDQQHQTLKALAALQGKSIKEYAIERLFPNVGEDEQALTQLRQLLETRLTEARNNQVSNKSISEIAAEVIQASDAV